MSSSGATPQRTVEAEAAYDPIQLRVVHNRLATLMRLMMETLRQLTGSPVVREGGDCSTAVMDADGRIVAFGSAVNTHLGHEVLVVPWIYDNLGRETVADGDVYMSNDPFTGGAVHPSDVGLVAPVFEAAELVAWVFCDMHFSDVGGMLPGSFSPDAIDTFAEAVRFPPTKIYAGGVHRTDVVRAFTNNTRVPDETTQDVAAMVGSINFAIQGVRNLAREYGVARLKALMTGQQRLSEELFRARLRQIPDGVYESADYIEDGYKDEGIYRAHLLMTVAGDELLLDFSQSSPPAPALLNCTTSGLLGGALGPFIQQIASDIPFNAGVMAAVHIKASDSFINAPYPTPVGLATGYGAWAVQEAIIAAASSALQAAGGELAERTTAQWAAQFPCYIFTGASNQHGRRALFLSKDTSGVGQGAMHGLDGSGGPFVSLHGSIPSVEAHEAQEPLLFLSRQNWIDSGGAGRWRGGVGIRSAVIVWGEQSSPLSGTFCTGRNAIPEYGLYGGYPASGVYYGPIAGTDAWEQLHAGEISTLDDLEQRFGGNFDSLPSKAVWQGSREIGKGAGAEVFVMTHPGGGGYGDPLARDPQSVSLDVIEGIVSAQAARGAYGVVLDAAGTVDVEATATRREQIRRERIGRARDAGGAEPGPPTVQPRTSQSPRAQLDGRIQIGPVAWDSGAATVSCVACEERLCAADENWKEACLVARGSASERLRSDELGSRWRIRPHDEVELAEVFCPYCHSILAVEWYLRDEPFRWTFRTLEGARAHGYDASADLAENPEGWLVF
jgi:N-methylhydantoinase B